MSIHSRLGEESNESESDTSLSVRFFTAISVDSRENIPFVEFYIARICPLRFIVFTRNGFPITLVFLFPKKKLFWYDLFTFLWKDSANKLQCPNVFCCFFCKTNKELGTCVFLWEFFIIFIFPLSQLMWWYSDFKSKTSYALTVIFLYAI